MLKTFDEFAIISYRKNRYNKNVHFTKKLYFTMIFTKHITLIPIQPTMKWFGTLNSKINIFYWN